MRFGLLAAAVLLLAGCAAPAFFPFEQALPDGWRLAPGSPDAVPADDDGGFAEDAGQTPVALVRALYDGPEGKQVTLLRADFADEAEADANRLTRCDGDDMRHILRKGNTFYYIGQGTGSPADAAEFRDMVEDQGAHVLC